MIHVSAVQAPGHIQDTGRYGHFRYGIGHVGAMDTVALAAGNILLGNDEAHGRNRNRFGRDNAGV